MRSPAAPTKLYTPGQTTTLPQVDINAAKDPLEVTYAVTTGEGNLTATASSGATVTGSGTKTLKVTGPQAGVNPTLHSVAYVSPANEATGSVEISVRVKDGDNQVGSMCNAANGITLISSTASKTPNKPKATVCIKGSGGSIRLFLNGNALHPDPVQYAGSILATLQSLASSINGNTSATPPITASVNSSALTMVLTVGVATSGFNGMSVTAQTTGSMALDSNCGNKFEGGTDGGPTSLSEWFDDFLEKDLQNLLGQAAGTFATGLLFSHILPNESDVQIKLPSELFETESEIRISFLVEGMVLKVPNTYDANTHSYGGGWDGVTFKDAVTDDPCWIFRDYLTNKRYGCGNDLPLTPAQQRTLDQDLYRISQYGNQAVDSGRRENGAVVMEPRYTCNTVLTGGMSKIEILQAIASVFNGQMVVGGFGVRVFADMPTSTKLLVNQTNVHKDGFSYSGGSIRNLYNVAMVKWNNPAKFYALDFTRSEDRPSVLRYGEKIIEEVAFGCTSAGQAVRKGNWLLATEKANPLLVTYRAGLDHSQVIPGDVVMIEDSDITLSPRSGRVTSTVTTHVTFDAPITIPASGTWSIHVMIPDGTIATRQIASWRDSAGATVGSGVAYGCNLASALPAVPVNRAVYNITGTAATGPFAPRLFRVLKVTEHREFGYDVVAQAYDPNKYAAIEQNVLVSA
ncbi:phage tail protein [Azospirillum baldaniorum]|uniref:Tip attachment protein J domain-containing protein n=1 Tax=Azospirillum baldaniorum TaxID=1064539 RepID=A0A9P1JY49_9PROT|nr:phage tail protein [Azospirillum baldaniorum]CCD02012.1 protein of unknown function [Azospirillum baldaniorum]